ncbi:MAG TPA: AAA family ATPase [Armatimonadota bacterium]|jgi:DNA repair exonuclease SbcCD ATPase subunit
MEFIELGLNNFKRFSESKFHFSPGLTLLWGKNEAGKSTLLEAICTALYGRERGKVIENWNGGNCSTNLTYRTGGKTWRLERRLTEGTASLGVVSGDQLTDATSSRDEIAKVIAEHLGISSRQVLENTVFVRQMCVHNPDKSDLEVIGGEIQRILTGTAHVSAGEARKRLEEKRDAVKGRARPTNPREYDQITAKLRGLAEELANARNSRERIHKLEDELSNLDERTERDSARLEIVIQLLERYRKWSELKKRLDELDARHADVFATCRKIKDTLLELSGVQKELETFADLVGKDDEIADHLTKIQSRRGELDSRIGELNAVNTEAQPIAGRFKSLPALASGVLILVSLVVGFLVDRRALWLILPGVIIGILSTIRSFMGRASESRQIGGLILSAENEQTQLEAELDSILTYVNCRDIDQALAMIKTYRSLVTRSSELEFKLGTLLNSKSIQEWDDQEAGIARELSTVRADLDENFPDYSPSTEEAESWRGEHNALQHQLPTAQARMHEVTGALESERNNARDLASLEGEIEFLHMRKQELEFTYKAYEEAISALTAITESVSEEYLPMLSERASDLLAWMTSGRYTSVEIRQGWEIVVGSTERTGMSPSDLSIGTIDQLYFSLRIACGELLSSDCRLPMILDDPFAAFDRERLANVLSLLAALSRERQIIMLTHDPYVLDWAKSISASGELRSLIHELPSPNVLDLVE